MICETRHLSKQMFLSAQVQPLSVFRPVLLFVTTPWGRDVPFGWSTSASPKLPELCGTSPMPPGPEKKTKKQKTFMKRDINEINHHETTHTARQPCIHLYNWKNHDEILWNNPYRPYITILNIYEIKGTCNMTINRPITTSSPASMRYVILFSCSTQPKPQTPNWSRQLCHIIISRWRWKFHIRNAVLIFHCVRRWRRNECESIPRTCCFCTNASPHHRITSTFTLRCGPNFFGIASLDCTGLQRQTSFVTLWE